MGVLGTIIRGLTRSLQSEETDDQTKGSKKDSTFLSLIRRGLTWSLQKPLQDDAIDFSYVLGRGLRIKFTSSDELSKHIFHTLKNGFNNLLAPNNGQNNEEALIDYYQDTIYNIFKEVTHYPSDATSLNRKKILKIRRYYLDNQEAIMSSLLPIDPLIPNNI